MVLFIYGKRQNIKLCTWATPEPQIKQKTNQKKRNYFDGK